MTRRWKMSELYALVRKLATAEDIPTVPAQWCWVPWRVVPHFDGRNPEIGSRFVVGLPDGRNLSSPAVIWCSDLLRAADDRSLYRYSQAMLESAALSLADLLEHSR
jgi:hypothetical protein